MDTMELNNLEKLRKMVWRDNQKKMLEKRWANIHQINIEPLNKLYDEHRASGVKYCCNGINGKHRATCIFFYEGE